MQRTQFWTPVEEDPQLFAIVVLRLLLAQAKDDSDWLGAFDGAMTLML
jgi:hypothetical protein